MFGRRKNCTFSSSFRPILADFGQFRQIRANFRAESALKDKALGQGLKHSVAEGEREAANVEVAEYECETVELGKSLLALDRLGTMASGEGKGRGDGEQSLADRLRTIDQGAVHCITRVLKIDVGVSWFDRPCKKVSECDEVKAAEIVSNR